MLAMRVCSAKACWLLAPQYSQDVASLLRSRQPRPKPTSAPASDLIYSISLPLTPEWGETASSSDPENNYIVYSRRYNFCTPPPLSPHTHMNIRTSRESSMKLTTVCLSRTFSPFSIVYVPKTMQRKSRCKHWLTIFYDQHHRHTHHW